MKRVWAAVIAVLCIGLVIGGYYYLTNRDTSSESNKELTVVQKIITKDLSISYPATPREVVKTYNEIISCYYKEDYTEEEWYELGDQARALFDEELLEANTRDEYFIRLKAEIQGFKDEKRNIVSINISSSNEVDYKTIEGRECAYVKSTYFLKEGNSYARTYQMFVLRKDENGRWKILGFYLEGDDTGSE